MLYFDLYKRANEIQPFQKLPSYFSHLFAGPFASATIRNPAAGKCPRANASYIHSSKPLKAFCAPCSQNMLESRPRAKWCEAVLNILLV